MAIQNSLLSRQLSRCFGRLFRRHQVRQQQAFRRARRGSQRHPHSHAAEVQVLETRVLLSSINWENRGSDGFGVFDIAGGNPNAPAGYGSATARGVVDAAIGFWENIIEDFNWADPPPGDEFDVTININSTDTGFGASTPTTVNGDGIPISASINIGRGADLNSDGLGDGAGWFLDTTPNDWSEFTAVNAPPFVGSPTNPNSVHAFKGFANTGPASVDPVTGNFSLDLFSLVNHELGHAIGLFNSTLMTAMSSDTMQQDSTFNIGNLWAFNGPSVQHLFTGNNGGGGGSDFGGPVHTAEQGDSVSLNGTTYTGVDDLLTPIYGSSTRWLATDAHALVLQDAYGYDIALSSTFGTMYTVFDESTGELFIRGRDGDFDDHIRVDSSGSDLTVSVDPGGLDQAVGSLPGQGDLGFFETTFDLTETNITSIRIETDQGEDTIEIHGLPNGLPTTLDTGIDLDVDTVIIGGGDLDTNIRSSIDIFASSGDELTLNDLGDSIGNDTYEFISGSGFSEVFTKSSMIGGATIGITGFDLITLEASNFASQDSTFHIGDVGGTLSKSIVIDGNLGDEDTIILSPDAMDLSEIAANVVYFGQANSSEVIFNDQNSNDDRRYVIDGAPFATEEFDYDGLTGNHAFFADQFTLNASAGDNTFDVRGTNAGDWEIFANDGADRLFLSSAAHDLDTIDTDVIFHGEGGNDQFIVRDDNSNAGFQNWDINDTTLIDDSTRRVEYHSTELIDWRAADGGNRFDLTTLNADLEIVGSAGNDTVIADYAVTPFFAGQDSFSFAGNGGADTLSVRNVEFGAGFFNTDFFTGSFDGGDGFNTLDVSFRTAATVFLDNNELFHPDQPSGQILLPGTSIAHAGVDLFYLFGSDESDQIDASAFTLADPSIVISGGAGSDTLIGGAGDDEIFGGSGSDNLVGNDGDDFLDGGIGNKTFDGGNGDDHFKILPDVGSQSTVVDYIGFNTLDFSDSPEAVSVDLSLNDGQSQTVSTFETSGGSSFPNRLVLNGNFQHLIGSDFSDTLFGTLGDDRIEGRGGSADFISGRSRGDDLLVDGRIYTVTSETDDGTGGTTLREAVTSANNKSEGDAILFDESLRFRQITLANGEIGIDDHLQIVGLGADDLAIDANNQSRIFNIDDGTSSEIDVSIRGLTLLDGSAVLGGAIVGRENLTLREMQLLRNSASSGGAVAILGGGNLTVVDSTFFQNTASANGGAIQSGDSGTVQIINSTLTNNFAANHGGAVRLSSGTLITRNATILGNMSDSNDGGAGDGGGIWIESGVTATLYNSIVAGNFKGVGTPADNDIDGVLASSSSNNLIGDAATSGGLTNGANSNIVGNDGTGTIDLFTVVNDRNGILALDNFGGRTLAIQLAAGSPAIDAGNNFLAIDQFGDLLDFDQRGNPYSRVADGDLDGTATVDIGAFEVADVLRLDDGDLGFSLTGDWDFAPVANFPDPTGHEGDIRFTLNGDGSKTARWEFAGLLPGNYRISATWPEHPNRATDAPFRFIQNSNDASAPITLASATVNQELAPDDFTEDGSAWENIGLVTYTGDSISTLVVELSNDANQYVIADAVRIERTTDVPPPPSTVQIIDDQPNSEAFSTTAGWTKSPIAEGRKNDVRYASAGDGSRVATWTFTDLTPGQAYDIAATWSIHPNRATNAPFTIRDGADGNAIELVRVNQEQAPDDFSDDGTDWENLTTVVASGTELVVELSNDANQYVIADAIRIEPSVAPPPPQGTIIDNGDSSGFEIEGQWSPSPITEGHNGDILYASAGNGSRVARWTFTGLVAGEYQVAASWSHHPNRATDAPFTILDSDGTSMLAQVDVNQEVAPDDFTTFGSSFENLSTVLITGGTLVVELSNDANQFVIADAIRIEPVASGNMTALLSQPTSQPLASQPDHVTASRSVWWRLDEQQDDLLSLAEGTR